MPKTVIDLCRSKSSENRATVADAALRGHCTGDELWATLDAYPRSPGNARARELLEEASSLSESIGESLTKRAVVEAGVARPGSRHAPLLQQVAFHDARGFIGRVDIFIPTLGLVIEFDGNIKYADGGAGQQETINRELAREKRLKNLRLTVVRIVWNDLFGGAAVAIIRRAAEEIEEQIRAGFAVYSGEYVECAPEFEVEQGVIDLAILRKKRWRDAGRLY
nr:hypothetical protein [Corynebacterium lactis]